MKQMFDISNEIYGVNTINWENFARKYLSLIGDEQIISSQHTKKLRIFIFCIVSWKDEREPQSNMAWENRLTWFKSSQECRAKLILEQSDEIFGVSQISWESFPWKQLSLVNDEEVISLSHAKVYVFSDSVLCLGNVNQNPTSNTNWEQQLG